MKFINENNNVITNIVSKSKLEEESKCSQKVWRDLRTDRTNNNSISLNKAKIFNILAYEELNTIFNIEDSISLNEKLSSYKIEEIFEIQNQINQNIDFELLFKNQELLSLGEIITVKESGMDMKIAPSAITYREIKKKPYIAIYEFKSGFNTIYEVDKAALFVAYVIFKKYNLPIIINRLNLRSGKIWSEEISLNQIKRIEPFILEDSKKYLERVNSEIIPEFTPGSVCSHCEHIEKCEGRKYPSNLKNKFKIVLWAKELIKKYEKEIKDYSKEVINNSSLISKEGNAALPFLNGKYGAEIKTSKSFQLPNRKLKKQEVIKKLLESKEVSNESIIDSLDIKFSEEISEILLEKLNISLKENYRTTLKIEESD